MQLFVCLILACVAATAFAEPNVCRSNYGQNVAYFGAGNKNEDTLFPCKYWALRRQQCGKYSINLSPGLRYLYGKYYLDTLWLGINVTGTDDSWEGRTTNKIAVKYFNRDINDLFNQKGGNLNTSQILKFDLTQDVGVYVQDKEDTFKITFMPWDANNRKQYPVANWRFECLSSDDFTPNEYPAQLCGGNRTKRVLEGIADTWDLEDRFRHIVIYHDVFTNKDIVQTNPQCKNATDLLHTCKDRNHTLLVLRNCQPILHIPRITKCITRYHCDPMDAFNACLKWGCTGNGFEEDEEELCAAVAESIDYCPEINHSGNLTDRVKAANCYRNFIPIEGLETGDD